MQLSDLNLKNEWWTNPDYRPSETKLPQRDLFYVIEKNLEHPLMLNIVGLRRVGKSTILKQIISRLLDNKVKPVNIFYFLFDYSYQVQQADYLDEVLSTYFKNVIACPGLSLTETVYIFLDEIQYIDNWQSILKRYYDLSGKKIKFIITGSQSVLLKGKYRESLAGRIFDYYLPPLSFREFIKINQENTKLFKTFDLFELPSIYGELSTYNDYYGAPVAKLSREYLTTGQFPEIRQLPSPEMKQAYITESVIGKVIEDCIRIFNIDKTDEFKIIAKQILNNTGSLFEQSNISREIAISRLTLDRYLDYLKEAYILELLYKYHKSPIKSGRLLKKAYTPCVNFACALNHYKESHIDEVPQAFGKIIENIVYNVLSQKYQGSEITDVLSFWRQGDKEIDFLVKRDDKLLPIEVKFSNNINFNNLTVITDFIKNKKLNFGVLVTKDELSQKKVAGQMLYYIPYYLILMMI